MLQQTFIWGAFCLAVFGLCLWRPRAGRIFLGVFFILMALGVNVVFALVDPDGFARLGTDAPLLAPYEWVFAHVVTRAPVAFGLLVAAFEITVGVLLIRGGRWTGWGLVGGIAFLVVISPLGPWTLPNLIMAAALGVLLWHRRMTKGPATAVRRDGERA